MFTFASLNALKTMRSFKILALLILIFSLFSSCKKDFEVNTEWSDITIVYGLINQGDSLHYLKITKAFLGPGNALDYAKIPDSSMYRPGELTVYMDEWDMTSHTFLRTIYFDTTTIYNKEPGDSVFYFPEQLVYKTNSQLKQNYTYKLTIKNNFTGKIITSSTSMIYSFSVQQPDVIGRVNFMPGTASTVEWTSAKGGKRYQLVIRFHYSERPIDDPASPWVPDSLDWTIFQNVQPKTTEGGEQLVRSIAGNTFYSVLAAKIPVDPTLKRSAGRLDYIFSVASEDLNTYMEVTEPSSSIVQYRPPFTNITNGIGLFSSRFVKTLDSLRLSDNTLSELHTNPKTSVLGF